MNKLEATAVVKNGLSQLPLLALARALIQCQDNPHRIELKTGFIVKRKRY